MKKLVFALLALLSLFSFTQAMAQTPPVENPATAPVSDATAAFLATLGALGAGQPQISDDQVTAPLFMTGCPTGCATGEICCYLCGNPPEGDDSGCWGCVTPVPKRGGGCPQVY